MGGRYQVRRVYEVFHAILRHDDRGEKPKGGRKERESGV